MRPCSRMPGHRVHRAVLQQRRAGPRQPGEVERRVEVHERQRHELGEAAGLVLDAGEQPQVRDPVRGVSTWPYIIVDVVGMPSACAVVMTSTQVAAGSLPLVSTQRTSSSRISAAVPGSESTPASFAAVSHSRDRHAGARRAVDDLHRAERVHVQPRLRVASPRAAMSKYAVPGRSGWMPPCMHTSVAPTSPRPPRPASPTSVERQRVGVGVGASLRERAEPAAGVADVGEVDVAVDDVGDVVADRCRGAASSASCAARRSRRRASRRTATSASSSDSPPGSRSACRSAVTNSGRCRCDGSAAGTALPRGARRRSPQRRPVAVRRVEVDRVGRTPALGVDGGVQVDAAGVAQPPSGSCHGRPDRPDVGARQTAIGRAARRRAGAAAGPATARRGTADARSAARCSSKPASLRTLAQLVELRPRALGVDVVRRQRRHAAPVVDAGGEQPRALAQVDEVGRRLHAHAAGRARAGRPRPSRRTRRGRSRPACRIAVSGLARKFWTITSCTCRYCRASAADREQRLDPVGGFSPMPTRMPGRERRRWSGRRPRCTRSRTAGSLSGTGAAAALATSASRLEHHAHRRAQPA